MTVIQLEHEVICFAGDSGDGIQLLGERFSDNSSKLGNDVMTLPDYPAEIRAPSGTTSGVSAFQLQFSSSEIFTPGDEFSVLIALNAAALKSKLAQLAQGGLVLIDLDGFSQKNLELAGYQSDPLTDNSLSPYRVIADNFTRLTVQALAELTISSKLVKRSKNFFMLGIVFWIYSRSLESTLLWIREKFASNSVVMEANILALKSGFNYAETTEIFSDCFQVAAVAEKSGLYRTVSGNEALSLGLVCAADKLKRPLFLGSYPITPASDILHTLAQYQRFGVTTFQAEDEIAAACSALGASYAGALGATSTSGPGLCLKTETINLAVMAELPLVVINVQRGGPSTGLPTKTEQSDLLLSMYGRNGDSPLPVLAAASPADCFDMALEACRLATTFMTPVILLSDGYLANGSESWQVPNPDEMDFALKSVEVKAGPFHPYQRDESYKSRSWVIPGTKDKMHRIGGLEKQSVTGEPSHDPENHQRMTEERAEKINNIRHFIPKQTLTGNCDDSVLVMSWGGTLGSVATAIAHLRERGAAVAHVHLRYLNPFPANLETIIKHFDHVLVFELNNQQLVKVIRSQFGIAARSVTQVNGLPFKVRDVADAIEHYLEEINRGEE
ncbi:2-oxoacid:acceptor oxidoreductase subunit alpha [Vibrio fluvialis]|jgi:2-oxoglutarate ferredoxin oxidoreductase subunit alpha|uniref:2-oxoacid:acceptor oxidoreductase subunit alpha n=1 Tax=Vibrio fluvialis TaxID=676 RepID=UPI001C9BBE4B|nr:2-oxoacid:acceptor oxidoreductase subunit alpha [Vibrio fluvialis]EKO3384212.1 2-oxoacid:acceptor oxidoreductase subunit alpha [Vibrio fluvialis]EKO3436796.1 2-oxoacid:acceptor oxidoreductase subunit alpha [Vibrio fluvialis]ELL0571244.1 2-oxoacid:acceptor oxidoreductase subunit alpha [Vibrio fluvialis]MBY7763194.1 2-oxoacid:acceptor oxidoreductase subunit alpha [Vibrio fluvialis]MBY7771813.1 2-oxoacid:acceptor oxidoreductase subunit alpha [Vibrio fluvialis]